MKHGDLLVAETTAREIGRISLLEALELTALIAVKASQRQAPRCSAMAPPLPRRALIGHDRRGGARRRCPHGARRIGPWGGIRDAGRAGETGHQRAATHESRPPAELKARRAASSLPGKPPQSGSVSARPTMLVPGRRPFKTRRPPSASAHPAVRRRCRLRLRDATRGADRRRLAARGQGRTPSRGLPP